MTEITRKVYAPEEANQYGFGVHVVKFVNNKLNTGFALNYFPTIEEQEKYGRDLAYVLAIPFSKELTP